MKNFGPITNKMPHMIHGGDYNPDQWRHVEGIVDEDMRLMKIANCNCMSVGIFSWAALEPEEGVYDFSWLDESMDKIAENGNIVCLATPTGSRPAWMSQKYPEVLRVNPERARILHSERHNHCYTSPIYREKAQNINRLLAQRYKDHPALGVWHISNEYGGECHCDLCQKAFREWLKGKYTDLKTLNLAWWNSFWGHTYTSWEQIESPSPIGEFYSNPSLFLDWKRFVTHQTVDFMKAEIAPIKEITPDIPVTTNFMGTYPGLDYFKFKDTVDVVSWDSYPFWHAPKGNTNIGSDTAFIQDINRCILHKPFMLMESVPGAVNWQSVNKLKKPGMHILSSLQAVAHGSDTVQYFQWRKGRGGAEQFHGAVVDHVGHENTRVFREVAATGAVLKKLDKVVGTPTQSSVAIIYDWENRWALDEVQAIRRDKIEYEETCKKFYKPFWENGINVDVIDMDCDIEKYKVIVLPILYMLKPGFSEKLTAWVKRGGIAITTYWTGIVNETNLCHLGGFPGPLRELFGVWSEEIDALYDDENNYAVIKELSLPKKEYEIKYFCDIIHPEGAKVLAEYKDDFFKGNPCLTENKFGEGKAYYIAFRDEGDFTLDFINHIIEENNIEKNIDTYLPDGVTAQSRCDEENTFIFLQNYNGEEKCVDLKGTYFDMVEEKEISGVITLDGYSLKILKK